ncbi:hypothetical protein DAPPUDRAFT_232090 [Daphnia pulex]|uniref:Uncharacterized protein n=1 Tax=Daphnia pulex TaxID=6669 RepID=E9FRW6_DAPPU|nr:hypothetical protein DAPPUDRAFT_232090 [Daphnia pulex]|eukprot:EFX89918.1 hypothetical protein DAPPUDRAFT_232090 [Daphnia pulex]
MRLQILISFLATCLPELALGTPALSLVVRRRSIYGSSFDPPMEERREGDETISRENRRIAGGSAGNGEDLSPPKSSRVPATHVGIGGSAGKSSSSEQSLSGPSGAQQRSFSATDAR